MHGDAPQRKEVTFDCSGASFNSKYLPLLHNKAEFLHLYGSAGSGKSRFEAQKEVFFSTLNRRRNRKTLVIRKYATTLKDSVYAECKSVISEWGWDKAYDILKSPLHITNKYTRTEFLFIGLDDIEKVKSISGVDRIWIEEATELQEKKELDQLRLRLRGYDEVQITLCYNPVSEHHWLNTEIHEEKPEGHAFFHSTYRDNEQLLAVDPNYGKFIESTKDTNPNYYRVYGLGLWGQVVEGLIYPDAITGVKFPQDDSGRDDIHAYGLDFGYSDPTALVAQHVKDALPKKQLINKEILYQSGLDAPAMVQRFNDLGIRRDIQIVADNARPEMIKSLQDAGYKVRACEKAPGSVLSGINRVRKYQLCIAAGSKNLTKEVHNYQKNQAQGIWTEDPAKNQIDHGMDAIRYAEQAQDNNDVTDEERGIFGRMSL